jgi:hypothetical protein
MYFNSLIRLLIVCLCCTPILSSASPTKEQYLLLEFDTSENAQPWLRSERTPQEALRDQPPEFHTSEIAQLKSKILQGLCNLGDQLRLSKHTKPLLDLKTNEEALQELFSLQYILSTRLTRYRATMYFQFQSILTTGYILSDTLDLYINNLQCLHSNTMDGTQAGSKKCFQENINDLKDLAKRGITMRVKDVNEGIQQVMREMDELKEFIIDIEENVLKLLAGLENTVKEVSLAEDIEQRAFDRVGILLRDP